MIEILPDSQRWAYTGTGGLTRPFEKLLSDFPAGTL